MTALKLAPHVHTRHSDDCDWSLERLAAVLSRAGFDGALVCDHDRTMDAATWRRIQSESDAVADRTGFLLIPGIEYQDPDHIVHLPVFGWAPFYGRSPGIGDLLRQAHADGAASVFAHPRRRDAYRRFDPEWAAFLTGIEAWNRKYDGIRPNGWALEQAARLGVAATVALDWHGPRQLYPLALRVPDPGAGSNRERGTAVVNALLEGRGTATAFGLGLTRFDRGVLGGVTRTAESARRVAAPALRRAEKVLRRP